MVQILHETRQNTKKNEYKISMLEFAIPRTVGGTVIGVGLGVCIFIYSRLPDRFLFKLIKMIFISKETCQAEREYMNIAPPMIVRHTSALSKMSSSPHIVLSITTQLVRGRLAMLT